MRVCPRCRAVYSAQIERCPSDGERVLDDQRDPLIGQTLDRYRIVEPLGEGAMGGVYRATHVVLPRDYALKVLYRDLAANQKLVERFRREAQAVSTMEHPNIVSVFDFVTLPGGVAFIVMELVPGRTLERAITAEAPFTPARAASIVRQVAAGLGEAHRRGFVHRDVKPSNIMLTDSPAGELVKVLDFGVVGLEAATPDTRLTAVGHIIGTPTYMAPEQVHDPAVGPAADLYALGVILFEMLAGEPPFQGADRTQVFVKHISEPPPPLPPSAGLEHLAHWLLEKKAAKRPRTAEELVQAIDRLALDLAPPRRTSLHAPVAEIDEVTLRPSVFPNGRPERRAGSSGRFNLEADTFRPEDGLFAVTIPAAAEQDTDAELRKGELAGAFDATVPRIESVRPLPRARGASMLGARFGGSALAEVSGPSAAGDEPFPTLPTGASGADWPAWDPDGAFTAQRLPAEQTDTQPSVLSEPSGARAAALDLVLDEPELPVVPDGETAKHRVDDGPTQVDFDASLLPSDGDPPLAIPVTDESLGFGSETRSTDPELALGRSNVPDDSFERLDASTAVDLEAPSSFGEGLGAPLERAPERDTAPDPEDPGSTGPTLQPGAGAHAPAALKALDLPQLGPEHFRPIDSLDAAQGPTLQDFARVQSWTERVNEPSATAPYVPQAASKTVSVSTERAAARSTTSRARVKAALIGLLIGLALAAVTVAVGRLVRPRPAPVVPERVGR